MTLAAAGKLPQTTTTTTTTTATTTSTTSTTSNAAKAVGEGVLNKSLFIRFLPLRGVLGEKAVMMTNVDDES